jgi:hypothetical protein
LSRGIDNSVDILARKRMVVGKGHRARDLAPKRAEVLEKPVRPGNRGHGKDWQAIDWWLVNRPPGSEERKVQADGPEIDFIVGNPISRDQRVSGSRKRPDGSVTGCAPHRRVQRGRDRCRSRLQMLKPIVNTWTVAANAAGKRPTGYRSDIQHRSPAAHAQASAARHRRGLSRCECPLDRG